MIAEEERPRGVVGSFKNNAPVFGVVYLLNIPNKKFQGFLEGSYLNLFLSDKAAFSREG